jgi:hypothetical protein
MKVENYSRRAGVEKGSAKQGGSTVRDDERRRRRSVNGRQWISSGELGGADERLLDVEASSGRGFFTAGGEGRSVRNTAGGAVGALADDSADVEKRSRPGRRARDSDGAVPKKKGRTQHVF